ncbi:MAG: type II toxin-antitoxin system Phd/YefM family antitoxin [Acidimicrobiia bacterium]
MVSIGVRELRRDASQWLARVRAGETIVVTDRGRPVARLAPLGPTSGYEAFVAEGRIQPGSGRAPTEVLAQLDADLPPDDGPSLSKALGALRDNEW